MEDLLLAIDDLLLAMEQQIQNLADNPKLQRLLTWAEQITDTSETDIKPVGKRAIALANALVHAYAKAKDIALGKAPLPPPPPHMPFPKARGKTPAELFSHNIFDYIHAYVRAKSHADVEAETYAEAKAKAKALANDYAQAYADILAKAEAYADALANAYNENKAEYVARAYTDIRADIHADAKAKAKALALEAFIGYAQKIEKLAVYKKIDLNELVDKLKKLKEQIQDQNQGVGIGRVWANKIIQIILEAFHLTTEMIDLSKEEIEALNNYFYTNQLMLDCKEAASQISCETWDKIEARMLLPKTSWEKLKQQS